MSKPQFTKTNKASRPLYYRPNEREPYRPIPPNCSSPETMESIPIILYGDRTIWYKEGGYTVIAPEGLLEHLQELYGDVGRFEAAPIPDSALLEESFPPSSEIYEIPYWLKQDPGAAKLSTTILEEANNIIYGDREQTYGHPAKNLNNIAAQWSLYLEQKYGHLVQNVGFVQLSAEDVCWMMVQLKMARQMNVGKRDNLVDAAGYIALISRIDEKKGEV